MSIWCHKYLFHTFHRPIYSFPRGTGNLSSQFNRLGTRLLCFGSDRLVVYDLPTLQHPTNGNMNEIVLNAPDLISKRRASATYACCFMGIDDEMVISGSDAGNLFIWSLPDAKGQNHTVDLPLRVLTEHDNFIYCVRYSNESSSIISCDAGGVIKLWSLPSVN